jgi:hypothetical protein
MHDALISQHLSMAQHHVARAAYYVARQSQIIAKLEQSGGDTMRARQLLASFEDVLKLHIAYRDRCLLEWFELCNRGGLT